MQRRSLLKLGFLGAAVLAVAGGGLALIRPGLDGGRLGAVGRDVFGAIARAVLDGLLPVDTAARDATLVAHLQRLDATLSGLPAATRAELSQLLALLGSAAGRRAVAGLASDWPAAGVAELQSALQSMRTSRLELRQQAYHALRDLTNAAYFAGPRTWTSIGYPGPKLP